MRHGAHRRRARTVFREVLPGSDDLYPFRRGSHFPLPMGGGFSNSGPLRLLRNDDVHCNSAGRLFLSLEKGRAGLAQITSGAIGQIVAESGSQNASVVPEQLRAWNANCVSEVIEFHGETTIVVPRELLRATADYCRAP